MRPPEDCSMCAGVDAVDRVSQITPDLFDQRFAVIQTFTLIIKRPVRNILIYAPSLNLKNCGGNFLCISIRAKSEKRFVN